MTLWTVLFTLYLYLATCYVNTYRVLNFGQNAGRFFSRPLSNNPYLTNCLLNWSLCPYVPRDMVSSMLNDPQNRGAQYQNDRILSRLLDFGRIQGRQVYNIANVTPPEIKYPYLPYSTQLSWSPRQPLNKDIYTSQSYITTTTEASPLSTRFLYSEIDNKRAYTTPPSSTPHQPILNKDIYTRPSYSTTNTEATPSSTNSFHAVIDSKRPVKDKRKSRLRHIAFGPKSGPTNNLEKIETTIEPTTVDAVTSFPLDDTTVPTAVTAAKAGSVFKFSGSAPAQTSSSILQSATILPPLNATPITYEVKIDVNTNSNDQSIKKYLTIRAFTEVPNYFNQTYNVFSAKSLNGPAENNNTFKTETEFRINSSRNGSSTSLQSEETEEKRRKRLLQSFMVSLDKLERKFYAVTFNKLATNSPENRRENGISFVQSGLFLSLQLLAFSTETDEETTAEIDECLGLNITKSDKLYLVKELISKLPKSTFHLKWRWSSRLVLGPTQNVSEDFRCGAAVALQVLLGKFYGNETNEKLAETLNYMVEQDSGGSIRNTFEPDELSDGVRAVALSTLYFRGRWRSAPTVLNGTRPFRDADEAPPRNMRMIRINDYMRYANLEDWKFKAIEIYYATRGLSLMLLVPNGKSLQELTSHLESISLAEISSRMITMRIAVSMPLYTLRMTLLLPSKLQAMGVNKLVNITNDNSGSLKLSHAVQRIMFWAEAGRNAFKDDGIEWDAEPEMELMVDRPYLFFVRYHNLTLMNGNFVL